MKYEIDDEVTIGGRWHIIEDIAEFDTTEYLVSDEDGYSYWTLEEEFD